MSKEDIDSINEGLKNDGTMATLKAASHFSDAGKKYLHIETLTDSYQNFLKTHKDNLATININPKPFTDKEIEQLNSGQSLFNNLDGMDNMLSKVGLGSPGVADKNADFDSYKEHLIRDILNQVEKLQSNDPAKIREGFMGLGKLNPQIDLIDINFSKVSAEQIKPITDSLITAVMKLRTSSDGLADSYKIIDQAVSEPVNNLAQHFIVGESIKNAQFYTSDGGKLVTQKELTEIIKKMDAAGIKHTEELSSGGTETLTATYSDKSTVEYKFKMEQNKGGR